MPGYQGEVTPYTQGSGHRNRCSYPEKAGQVVGSAAMDAVNPEQAAVHPKPLLSTAHQRCPQPGTCAWSQIEIAPPVMVMIGRDPSQKQCFRVGTQVESVAGAEASLIQESGADTVPSRLNARQVAVVVVLENSEQQLILGGLAQGLAGKQA